MSSHDAQGKSARWQFSLLGLMAATTLVCVGLAVLRMALIPLDRRAAAIALFLFFVCFTFWLCS